MGMVARWGEGRLSWEGGASAQLPAESGYPGRVGLAGQALNPARTEDGARGGVRPTVAGAVGDGTAASRNTREPGRAWGTRVQVKLAGPGEGRNRTTSGARMSGHVYRPGVHPCSSAPRGGLWHHITDTSCPEPSFPWLLPQRGSVQTGEAVGGEAQATSHGRKGQLGCAGGPPVCVDGGSLGEPHWCMGSCPV